MIYKPAYKLEKAEESSQGLSLLFSVCTPRKLMNHKNTSSAFSDDIGFCPNICFSFLGLCLKST